MGTHTASTWIESRRNQQLKLRTPVLIKILLLLSVAASLQSCAPRKRCPPFSPGTLTGRVVAITDGDTIRVLDSTKTEYRIRLQGINAPESRQAFYSESKQNLSALIFDREVTIEKYKLDNHIYCRIVGRVILDGRDIDLEQVKAGMAWHYKRYQHEQTPEQRAEYARAEEDARTTRRGLWQDSNPIDPDDFRRQK
jgi:endonuclease YncB( thermonuclease family)